MVGEVCFKKVGSFQLLEWGQEESQLSPEDKGEKYCLHCLRESVFLKLIKEKSIGDPETQCHFALFLPSASEYQLWVYLL